MCLICISLKTNDGEGSGTPLQYSCLESPMDGGAWRAAVHGVAEGRTRLSNFTFTFPFHALQKEMEPTPMFLPGESQGRGSLVGCRRWGRTGSDTTEVTQQRQQRLMMYSLFTYTCWLLCIFLGKISIQVLCLLFNWVICLFVVEF